MRWAHLVRQIAHRRLQRRLDGAHHVVGLHHLVGPVVAHGDQRATGAHQAWRVVRDFDEGVAGNLHGLQEALARTIHQPAVQIVLRAKAIE